MFCNCVCVCVCVCIKGGGRNNALVGVVLATKIHTLTMAAIFKLVILSADAVYSSILNLLLS